MSGLRSAIDEVRGCDIERLGDAALEEDFAEIHRAVEALEAERLRRLAAIDRRRTWAGSGHLSTTSWLSERFRMAWSHASRAVRLCRALREMPATRQALSVGEISSSAMQLLAHARESAPEVFPDHEGTLVDSARTLSFTDLRRVVGYWRQAADRDAARADLERMHERRRLHVSRTVFGMVRLDGDLDEEAGETLMTALRAVVDAKARAGSTDRRTPAQRRADALLEISRHFLDSAERPEVGGERPHVIVIVDTATLRGDAGRSELGDAGPIPPEHARRWACDASLSRVVMRGPSEVLDVGRRTAVVSAPMRRALAVRDGGCAHPSCDRPAAWCDAHHIVHWADGGTTSLANLVLLCRRHHRAIHQGERLDRAPPVAA